MSDSIDYVKKVVGPTLARVCAAVARENPTDHVDYLALWLKRYLECVAIKEETLEELNDARVKTADEEVRPRQPTTRGPHFPRPGPRPKTSPPLPPLPPPRTANGSIHEKDKNNFYFFTIMSRSLRHRCRDPTAWLPHMWVPQGRSFVPLIPPAPPPL